MCPAAGGGTRHSISTRRRNESSLSDERDVGTVVGGCRCLHAGVFVAPLGIRPTKTSLRPPCHWESNLCSDREESADPVVGTLGRSAPRRRFAQSDGTAH